MIHERRTMVSDLIAVHIERLAPRKSQRELAKEMGFATPNFLSMLKTGQARVPFGKIPVVAGVLGIDPALLLRLHLREQWPEFESVVFEIFGGIITAAEREWIEFFTEVGIVQPPADPFNRKLLQNIITNDWKETGE